MMRSLWMMALTMLLLIGCRHAPERPTEAPYEIQEVATSDRAMVVSAHPLATQIGLDILDRGGNAVDAAVAVQFALAVTYPRAGNIGGGGFMIIRDEVGRSYALDYRERAPASAHRDLYLDSTGAPIDGLSTLGHLAVGVPGSVHGLYQAWDSLGRMTSFEELIRPAIKIAREGFMINSREAERLNLYQPDFVALHDTSSSPFIRSGWVSGDTLRQEDLSATLERIGALGIPGFYEGETASMIVDEMTRGGGIITPEDLRTYSSVWRAPIKVDYRGHEVISMPPPSSGGVVLAQLLRMAEDQQIYKYDADACGLAHTLVEIERRAYADRAHLLGDMDYVEVAINDMLDADYLRQRMEDFTLDRATPSDQFKTDSSRLNLESFETTHTSIVDENGMAVSVTTTLNTNYGSKVLVKGSGFFLNNEMDDFSVKPGVPNHYGLIGNEKNAIAPGKRMLSSMTPTIVTRDNDLFLVLGTPGGSTIITSVLQVILHTIDHDMTLPEAVRYKRFHHQWLPDVIMHEPGIWPDSTIACLVSKGHTLKEVKRIGLVKAIMRRDDGSYIGVGDYRSDDHAQGL